MRISRLFAITAAVFALATMAVANPVNATAIGFQSGGTLTGSFTLNSNGTLATWDLTSTSLNGSHYTTSNDALNIPTPSPSSILFGGTLLNFNDQFANG